MHHNDCTQLLAEESTLRRLLSQLGPDDVLESSGLEARLADIRQQLDSTASPRSEPARARLTFRGGPVVGSHGILADFGTRATGAFSDAVTKIAAALAGPLSAKGPIPNRDECQLLITGTAVGSFGFEFEESPTIGRLDFGDESLAAAAFDFTRVFLESTKGSDDDLADSAAETDPRAVDALRSFLQILATSKAVCAFEFRNQRFNYRDVDEVNRAVDRLSHENLREETRMLTGEFEGVLPKSRTFEFRVHENDEIIRGKLGPAIDDAGSLNKHLNESVQIQVQTTRVRNGKPRYLLISPPEWHDQEI